MAWRRPGDKPLSEPMMVKLPTHICVTRPQWVNSLKCCTFGNRHQQQRQNRYDSKSFSVSWISKYIFNLNWKRRFPSKDGAMIIPTSAQIYFISSLSIWIHNFLSHLYLPLRRYVSSTLSRKCCDARNTHKSLNIINIYYKDVHCLAMNISVSITVQYHA